MVERSNRPTSADLLWKRLEFQVEQRRLHIIQPAIEGPSAHVSRVRSPVVPQPLDAIGDVIIIRHDTTPVTEAAQNLGGIEAEHRGAPERPRLPSAVLRPETLRGILDHNETVLFRDRAQVIDFAGATVELNWDDGLGALSHLGAHRRRIDEMVIPTVGKDRRRTRMVYGRPGRDEGVRGHDDLVPPADPRRQQCDQETVGTVADTESMLDTEVPREICLELVEFFLQDKPAR